jgi:hypothetical protein
MVSGVAGRGAVTPDRSLPKLRICEVIRTRFDGITVTEPQSASWRQVLTAFGAVAVVKRS